MSVGMVEALSGAKERGAEVMLGNWHRLLQQRTDRNLWRKSVHMCSQNGRSATRMVGWVNPPVG